MRAKLIKKGKNHYDLRLDDGGLYTSTYQWTSNGNLLSLKNCEAIERGYDLDKLVESRYPIKNTGAMFMPNRHEVINIYRQEGFIEGAKTILEILSDKKFSEKDMLKAFITGVFTDETSDHDFEFTELMKDLQQTEWEVEVEMEYYDTLPPTRQTGLRPKLDADGCLILRRKLK